MTLLTGTVLAWWSTISEADLLVAAGNDLNYTESDKALAMEAAANWNSSGASGRHLLLVHEALSLFGLDSESNAVPTAMAAGVGISFCTAALSSVLGRVVAAGVTTAIVAAAPVALPAGVAIAGGMAIGGLIGWYAQSKLDDTAEMAFDALESDALVEQAYEKGRDLGSYATGLLIPAFKSAALFKSMKSFTAAATKLRGPAQRVLRDQGVLRQLAGRTDSEALADIRRAKARLRYNKKRAAQWSDAVFEAAKKVRDLLGSGALGPS